MHPTDGRAPRQQTWLLLALLSLAPTLAAPDDEPCDVCALHDAGPDGGSAPDGGADAAPDAAPADAASVSGGGASDGCAVAPRDAAATLAPLFLLAAAWLPVRRRRR